ncbi:hypothetical protein Tco_1292554 [Tanacetum coccineum]
MVEDDPENVGLFVYESDSEHINRIGIIVPRFSCDKINCFKQNGLHASEYYHKLNSLWREFDILTKLSPCTCDAKNELSKHKQLMKLMQFLMGLDDVYQPTRSSLLTQTELHDVKDAFVIVCREESHKGFGSAKTPSHTIDRFFELIGYPNGFKKNHNVRKFSNNKGNSSNNVDIQKSSSCIPFTNEHIAKLISLIGDKPSTGVNQHITSSTDNMIDVVDISDLNITVSNPNGTISKIRKVGNLKLTNNIVLFDVLNLKRKNVLGISSEARRLYMFNTEKPSGSNTSSSSDSDDIAEEQSFDDDQGSVQIGEE